MSSSDVKLLHSYYKRFCEQLKSWFRWKSEEPQPPDDFKDEAGYVAALTEVEAEFTRGLRPDLIFQRLIHLVLNQHHRTKPPHVLNEDASSICRSVNIYNTFYHACIKYYGDGVPAEIIEKYSLGRESWIKIYDLLRLYNFDTVYKYSAAYYNYHGGTSNSAAYHRELLEVCPLLRVEYSNEEERQFSELYSYLSFISKSVATATGESSDTNKLTLIPEINTTLETGVSTTIDFPGFILSNDDMVLCGLALPNEPSKFIADLTLVINVTKAYIPLVVHGGSNQEASGILDVLNSFCKNETAAAFALINDHKLYSSGDKGVKNLWLRDCDYCDSKKIVGGPPVPTTVLTFTSLKIIED